VLATLEMREGGGENMFNGPLFRFWEMFHDSPSKSKAFVDFFK